MKEPIDRYIRRVDRISRWYAEGREKIATILLIQTSLIAIAALTAAFVIDRMYK